MIAAGIGHDRFLVWRVPYERIVQLLPSQTGLQPLHHAGEGWLLFAVAQLECLRIAGIIWRYRPQVAAWLVPCRHQGRIGNYFLSAASDDALTVLAMRGLGLPAQHARIRHTAKRILIPGQVAACVGPAGPLPDLTWFAQDRCGFLGGRTGVRRLPLAKQQWTWRTHAGDLHAPFAQHLQGRPVGIIDCSHDLATWGRPRTP